MKFICPLMVVEDIERAKNFYIEVLERSIKYDFGGNVLFEGDFAIQQKQHFAKMIEVTPESVKESGNNFELYFEEENFEKFLEKLYKHKNIKYIHNMIEHPWGQRVIRFYDPDYHIIEVGETMENVVRRFLQSGMTAYEAAKRSQYPIDFVEMIKAQL